MDSIDARGLTKSYGTRKALNSVSFRVPEGAFLSVFGPNGAGKTTLLRMLSTLERPSAGTVSVAGFDSKEAPDEVRARIGVVSHQSMLYPDLTAQENLMLYAQLYGVAAPDKRVAEILDAVGLSLRRMDPVRTYSRGMLQRAAIARALVHDPQIVLLDEPYSGLDPYATQVFDQLIASIREGRSFVMVSHDLAKGYEMCTHALVLARGKVVRFAAKDDLGYEEFCALCAEATRAGVA